MSLPQLPSNNLEPIPRNEIIKDKGEIVQCP